MKVLIGCEYTGTGQRTFTAKGHDAWSCDLDPTEGDPERHYQCDIFEALDKQPWDLIIIHPDCTKMAVCGNGTWAGTKEREQDIKWTLALWVYARNVCDRVCFENPVSVIHPVLRNHGADTQYIQPYQFGHPETKNTGLSKIGLPDLVETDNVYECMMTLPKKERHKVWYASPSETRGKDRSRSYPGIMDAMAEQWG
jgi:hypothetical protein